MARASSEKCLTLGSQLLTSLKLQLTSPLASPKPHSGFKKGGPRARRQSAGGESVSRAVSAASFSPLASPTPSSVGKPSARRQKEEALRQSEAALRQRNAELEEALATARATLETMALAALEENKSQLTHRLAEEDEAQAEAEVATKELRVSAGLDARIAAWRKCGDGETRKGCGGVCVGLWWCALGLGLWSWSCALR